MVRIMKRIIKNMVKIKPRISKNTADNVMPARQKITLMTDARWEIGGSEGLKTFPSFPFLARKSMIIPMTMIMRPKAVGK